MSKTFAGLAEGTRGMMILPMMPIGMSAAPAPADADRHETPAAWPAARRRLSGLMTLSTMEIWLRPQRRHSKWIAKRRSSFGRSRRVLAPAGFHPATAEVSEEITSEVVEMAWLR